MNRQIVLSKTAEKKLDKLLIYLETNWSENVKLRFISKLEQRIQIVKQKPEAFPKSEIKIGLHKCIPNLKKIVFWMSEVEEISSEVLKLEYLECIEIFESKLGAQAIKMINQLRIENQVIIE